MSISKAKSTSKDFYSMDELDQIRKNNSNNSKDAAPCNGVRGKPYV